MNHPFTKEEWETCIKVLTSLKDNPFNTPDDQTFKTLIAKIQKQAKKTIRKEAKKTQHQQDINKLKSSLIAENAINNKTLYTDKKVVPKSKYSTLNKADVCYSCGDSFTNVHFFYHRLCPSCSELNYEKRFQTIDLRKRNIVLTGGRVKVGYATALKFLNAGGNVIVTTRFPATAMQQYQQEENYDEWKDRLTIYGLDLRNLKSVQVFIEFVKNEFKHLDILVNNAAQTIQYPSSYYKPLIQNEQLLINRINNRRLIVNKNQQSTSIQLLENEELIDFKTNRFKQPIDKRTNNSWNAEIEDIDTFELLEVNLINQISPFLMIQSLKETLKKSPFEKRFIINVTSSEGQFSYANKTKHHPHTNMTKAAINMLTKTSAIEFKEDNILMNAVDVGWISTGVNEEKRKVQFEAGYIPPLDSVDGAARIFAPIKNGISGSNDSGKLFKNYQESSW